MAFMYNDLDEQLERLKIENKLLRAASEEQRELNGKLRVEYNALRKDYNLITSKSLNVLTDWNKWFDVWAIMLDGSCYDDAYDYYCQSRDVSETIESSKPPVWVPLNLNHKTLMQHQVHDVISTTERWDCQP